MLQREGLVVARKKRRKVAPYTQPFAAAQEPNRVWCAVFKGWFLGGDGARIDLLTLSDACSRYLLRCQAVDKTDTPRVRPCSSALPANSPVNSKKTRITPSGANKKNPDPRGSGLDEWLTVFSWYAS